MRISDWSSDVCSSDLQGCSSDAARIMGGIAPYEAQIPHLARSSRGSNWRCFTIFFHVCASSSRYRSPQSTLYVMLRSEEHTSELQSLMRISYAVLCLKKKNTHNLQLINNTQIEQ